MGATCSALWSVADGDGALLRDQLTTEHTIMRSRAAHVSLIGLLVVLSGVGARASLRTDAKGYADAFAEHLATVAHDASATEALQVRLPPLRCARSLASMARERARALGFAVATCAHSPALVGLDQLPFAA